MFSRDLVIVFCLKKSSHDHLPYNSLVSSLINSDSNYHEVSYSYSDQIVLELEHYLDTKERNRIATLPFTIRDTFIISHAFLRLFLSSLCGYNTCDISYHFNKNGKPFLPNSNVFFSLSRRVNCFAISLSNTVCGVDLEVTSNVNFAEISNNFLSKSEVNAIGLPIEEFDRINTFFKIWVKKESIIKALGLTLNSMPMIDTHHDKNSSLESLDNNNFVRTIVHQHSNPDIHIAYSKIS